MLPSSQVCHLHVQVWQAEQGVSWPWVRMHPSPSSAWPAAFAHVEFTVHQGPSVTQTAVLSCPPPTSRAHSPSGCFMRPRQRKACSPVKEVKEVGPNP